MRAIWILAVYLSFVNGAVNNSKHEEGQKIKQDQNGLAWSELPLSDLAEYADVEQESMEYFDEESIGPWHAVGSGDSMYHLKRSGDDHFLWLIPTEITEDSELLSDYIYFEQHFEQDLTTIQNHKHWSLAQPDPTLPSGQTVQHPKNQQNAESLPSKPDYQADRDSSQIHQPFPAHHGRMHPSTSQPHQGLDFQGTAAAPSGGVAYNSHIASKIEGYNESRLGRSTESPRNLYYFLNPKPSVYQVSQTVTLQPSEGDGKSKPTTKGETQKLLLHGIGRSASSTIRSNERTSSSPTLMVSSSSGHPVATPTKYPAVIARDSGHKHPTAKRGLWSRLPSHQNASTTATTTNDHEGSTDRQIVVVDRRENVNETKYNSSEDEADPITSSTPSSIGRSVNEIVAITNVSLPRGNLTINESTVNSTSIDDFRVFSFSEYFGETYYVIIAIFFFCFIIGNLVIVYLIYFKGKQNSEPQQVESKANRRRKNNVSTSDMY